MTLWPTWFESSVWKTLTAPVMIGIATIPATSQVSRLMFCSGIATSSTSRSRNGEITPSPAERRISTETTRSFCRYARNSRMMRLVFACRTTGSDGRVGLSPFTSVSKRCPGAMLLRLSVPTVWRSRVGRERRRQRGAVRTELLDRRAEREPSGRTPPASGRLSRRNLDRLSDQHPDDRKPRRRRIGWKARSASTMQSGTTGAPAASASHAAPPRHRRSSPPRTVPCGKTPTMAPSLEGAHRLSEGRPVAPASGDRDRTERA